MRSLQSSKYGANTITHLSQTDDVVDGDDDMIIMMMMMMMTTTTTMMMTDDRWRMMVCVCVCVRVCVCVHAGSRVLPPSFLLTGRLLLVIDFSISGAKAEGRTCIEHSESCFMRPQWMYNQIKSTEKWSWNCRWHSPHRPPPQPQHL